MNAKQWLERTELLIGEEKLNRLCKSHILVAGLGGVGGYAVEQLCRAGIGKLTIVDSDIVQPGNRNRQIIALKSTEYRKKTEVFRERLTDINPEIDLTVLDEYINETNIDDILNKSFDYVVDAIDTLTPKVLLLVKAKKKEIPVVSSMGSGGKFDPAEVQITDISKSHHCKFAAAVRSYLRKYQVNEGIDVVFSPETVSKSAVLATEGEPNKRSIVGTISYMPPIFGCFCAAVVINNLLK